MSTGWSEAIRQAARSQGSMLQEAISSLLEIAEDHR
jgi:hypothetical protein